MLPSGSSAAVQLRDVLASCLEAVLGRSNRLALTPVRHAVVVLVDGLGAEALAARSGHARTLAGAMTKKGRITSGFPTTTAAALASLTTGADPGTHGLVGYRVLDPAHDRLVNLLHGLDSLPADWQRCETVFERAVAGGTRSVVIGSPQYADSAFTASVLRGSEYLSGRSIDDRFDLLGAVLADPRPAIVYLYVPELDSAAHGSGWESGAWTAQLEALDTAVRAGVALLGPADGMVVTADHGMVDVPFDAHVLLDEIPGLLDGVRHVGGEARCLQLYLETGSDAGAIADRWRAALGEVAAVATRDEAVASEWFGVVHPDVLPRIGDVLVAATTRVAFYESATTPARGMVGQHGSWSRAERQVPLIRFGAWSAG
jgi:Type I phosphodiesterase / nucleotide pyrophosphatase